ncbi:YdiU family protein [Oceanobacillus piezotolerans]|uniref:Protein nucleotidyltransferase YdiU n=1 Tax=Oceanobacillus piezotolerans TaxID=2448030 RepID=A0A498DD83_9BACI|nr:YdiU family protein [Oceanobacillus piezotolerans]RLL40569.1 YdiU family protein [Oceanobacillus piezotolerans]
MDNTKEFNQIGWNFDNSYARLPKKFFSYVEPEPVRSPMLVAFNKTLANSLGLDMKKLESDEGVLAFGGNEIPQGSEPLAQAYAGHQFGHFTMLGDGRAVLLGEHMTPSGERYDIQLKGSGQTPYSRGGDGRATLGPMLREYIISEAMYGLGIPTTLSLAVVTTGEAVMREKPLPGAVLTRVAASHIRVGTFQYMANWGTEQELRILADYTIKRHFPEVEKDENPYLSLLGEVIKRQATLIAKWQHVGFIHGVMNTDNMAISGETIDYGPCAFMDKYDPATVFSSIDRKGRYAYGNQPGIAVWNLTRFAESLLPLLDENEDQAIEMAKDTLSTFSTLYHDNWITGMREKLGIYNKEEEDQTLAESLLKLMEEYNADYTNTFRGLTMNELDSTGLLEKEAFKQWHKEWKERLERQQENEKESRQLMRNSNPAVIPRNHRVEEALEAAVAKGDYSVMEGLLKVLSNPYAYSPEQEEYAKPPEPSDCLYQTFCGT